MKKHSLRSHEIRLDTLLSQMGYCSRRKVQIFLQNHRVFLAENQLQTPGTRLININELTIDGIPIKETCSKIYCVLNKPVGYICSSSDTHGRSLAIDLVPESQTYRLYNVGRLDANSCGLLLFTNDGYWAQQILHPRYGIEKEYFVQTHKPILKTVLEQMKIGICCNREELKISKYKVEGSSSCFVILKQGKNKEIRRLFHHFNLKILLLKRVRIGIIKLGNLMSSTSRILSQKEINSFMDK